MKLFTLLASAALISTPVLAADAIIYQEPTAPVIVDTFSWTGGYIGLNAGYGWGKVPSGIYEYENGELDDDHAFHDQNLNGFVGGVQAGYNWQFDRTVVGLETDIQGTSLKKSSIVPDYYDANLETKINWMGTTRVRLGYLPTERLLAYVTGGLAYGGVKATFSDYVFDDVSTSKTKVGYAVGAGLEYALADNWTVKGEYLFAHLGKLSHQAYDGNNSAYSATHKFQMHTVRVGVNYKF